MSDLLDRLTEIVGAAAVDTDPAHLREMSQDRFKKYQSVHGIYDGPQPAAIVRAGSTEQVSAVLALADERRVPVVPRTGGTGTEGGLEVVVEGSIVLDGSAMDRVLAIDAVDMQATVQCGVRLADLEVALNAEGLTTGHSPQSQPLAMMGGLVATRSIGQLSTLYGGIEDMVTGLEAVLPGGAVVRVRDVPRRAAGPDVRHVVIGNEGGLCFVTEVTVQVYPLPETRRFLGYFVDDLAAGADVLRQVVTAGFRPSVCRVYDAGDAAQHFAGWPGWNDRSVLVVVAEGPRGIVAATAAEVQRLALEAGAESVDPALVEQWFGALNWGPEKIEAEKEAMRTRAHLGYTTEVSVAWSRVAELHGSVLRRVREEFPHVADLTMLGAHSSHSYQTGTNLYFVYDYDIRCEPREEIVQYHQPLNAIIVEEALRVGGSMVHHHGVGKYRTPWVEAEHGSSWRLLAGLKEVFDPHGVMNPGTVWPR
ncbi:putative FAD-linked oxidoreductase YgcU [Marmoricola endophyticus]|uniref:FAD-linked oxidoreductase YgcU n=1 Tax=Marmoricola endophyticus TaxID=2040280 RepID=A0A917EYG7_9ACTN|nr:FAD-binding oxidoreductase [Marmoricola endophyticus]GGF30816.1 putative FAD-linked oxidoreductase YgcU [Marmoricola endophyticus]